MDVLKIKGMWFAGALVFAATWCAAARASEVAIRAIVANSAKFDRQNVQLLGTIADLHQTISDVGNDYTTFKLHGASGNALTIFMWGHPDLTNGENVRVNGEFETEHHVGRYTFYNEVEASSVAPWQ